MWSLLSRSQNMKIWLVNWILFSLIVDYTSANWWHLGLTTTEKSNNNDESLSRGIELCQNRRLLRSRVQRSYCNHNRRLVGQVLTQAARQALDECQYQFKDERWNCSSLSQRNEVPYARLATRTKSRETAFVHALTAAAAMYQVTKACARGELKRCACKRENSIGLDNSDNKTTGAPGYMWGGCSDNVLFGHKLSKRFVDADEFLEFDETSSPRHRRTFAGSVFRSNEIKERRLINLHNNEVGRRTILRNMRRACKCHGVSGSCSVKICWLQMPDFRLVGDDLFKMYKQARRLGDRRITARLAKLTEITPRRVARRIISDEELNEIPYSNNRVANYKDNLIFVDRSPDFCQSNQRMNTPGTSGRVCYARSATSTNRLKLRQLNSSLELDEYSINQNCAHLCCGRGYTKRIVEQVEECECQFEWCCSVKCKKCVKRTVQFVCL